MLTGQLSNQDKLKCLPQLRKNSITEGYRKSGLNCERLQVVLVMISSQLKVVPENGIKSVGRFHNNHF